MRTVLILDDEQTLLTILATYLKNSGYAVLACASSASAIERFHSVNGAIDLLIADVTMPVTSGVAVGLQLRSCRPGLKLLLTSGYPLVAWRKQDAESYTALPCDEVRVLEKPFSPRQLIGAMDELIGPNSLTAAVSRHIQS